MTIPVTTYQLAAELGALLLRKNFSITTAESCTGGGIAYVLTAVPGSSAYLDRSFVTYSNKSKQQLLGVKAETLLQYGAVSKETVLEMAVGAAKAAAADVAVAVSGIAGPDGGSATKPVGTVHFCFEIQGHQVLSQRLFDGDRATVRQQAIDFVLQQLILLLTD
ncbi:nicotinamide-nucleotide amidohydrolase family protein [Rheinheimera mesophila]|uniref:Nicotinamide-nucleotide amidohydrolase family protein n=1 Tax=Rheinheimera mesophila TaxID=1547515 RepID=A0A3P3QR81_9GAMM|nr:nicotinamide-nucleotide amidohydrolase family protein [Rheinheimera mesophila]KKL03258.1 damage-inducible protein CinA [Rheinheimera mesophila]RRJ23555.1 nicotinamide-nucleotide amidohydrolase family protein [Rheinheimera mesophila]